MVALRSIRPATSATCALCERSPGLEAWIVADATAPDVDDRVRHYGGAAG
jgi:hypothetical protein